MHFAAVGLETVPASRVPSGATVRVVSHLEAEGSMQIWTKNGVALNLGNPGNKDSAGLNNPSVIMDNGTYKMWYAGTDGVFPNTYILYADSPDGAVWTKHGVVLNFGPPGESQNVHMPTVLKDGSTFKMWYCGYDGSTYRIFHASSSDGLAWTRHGLVLNVGSAGSYDDYYVLSPYVLFDAGVYKMWYTGIDGSYARLMYATSPDGRNWTKRGLSLDIGPPSSEERAAVADAMVLRDVGGFHLWYSGSDGSQTRIFYATSQDGFSWTRHGRVLDTGGLAGGEDSQIAGQPSVVRTSPSAYGMWYNGRSSIGIDRILRANLTSIPLPMNVEVDFFADSISPATKIGSAITVLGVLGALMLKSTGHRLAARITPSTLS